MSHPRPHVTICELPHRSLAEEDECEQRRLAAAARGHAATLQRETDAIRAHCPDHGTKDNAWMACHCAVADDMMRRLATTTRQPADEDVVEAHRLALSFALGPGTSAPWDAIRDRATELHGAEAQQQCPGVETVPNRCTCDCEGCKQHCGAHNPAEAPQPDTETPEWARPETEEEKLVKARRMAKALNAPPVAPPGWATTAAWPNRHKRRRDRRVHATAPFDMGATREFWTACGKPIGKGGYPLSHMPVDCRDCKRAITAVPVQPAADGSGEETGAALARHLADRPVSEIQAAFRILGWPLRFELTKTDEEN